jgi:hypothetical protein
MQLNITLTAAGALRLGSPAGPAVADIVRNDPGDEPVFIADDIEVNGRRVGCCLTGPRCDGTMPADASWTFADGQEDLIKAL